MPVSFHTRAREEPEINLVPFIDVLLVILIFLMVSTTFTRLSELHVTLPTAQAKAAPLQRQREVVVAITAEGAYLINRKQTNGRTVDFLASQLSAASEGDKESVVVISADAATPHQSVINVMDAARRAGLSKLAFATRSGPDDAAPRAGKN
jgi:biopolymer transport protein ExbD